MSNSTLVVTIENRNYDTWALHNMETMEPISKDAFDPAAYKLFSMDVFTPSNDGKTIKIERSPVRSNPYISGVLVLKNNRTYGRHPKNGKLMYKCIPDDKRIPIFIVPYEIKDLGFNKVLTNLYVTFKFVAWTDKHPSGSLVGTIGPVDVLSNYFEYQLYCKSLNASIQKFNRDTQQKIKIYSGGNGEEAIIENIVTHMSEHGNSLTDRTAEFIFSIDPHESTDFDDAMSCQLFEKSASDTMFGKAIDQMYIGKPVYRISVYISNVTLLLDNLGIWKSFSDRVSTIYLPDRKRPMLPTILSDGLCSLVQDKTRLAFVMDLYIVEGFVLDIQYTNAKISVAKNYRYEEKILNRCPHYHLALDVVRKMQTYNPFIPSIQDSHDLVTYLMVFMNYNTAKETIQHRNGIFRNVVVEIPPETSIPDTLEHDVLVFFKTWNTSSAQYIDLSCLHNDIELRHDLLKMDAYLHITSPIRRLVDLLNMIQIQENMDINGLSHHATEFYKEWTDKIDYINTTMRSIRKMQNECSLVASVFSNPELVNDTYKGYVFDQTDRGGIWQYNVYIPKLKWMTKITCCTEMENYSHAFFQLHIFEEEDSCKRKIRVSLVENS